MKIEYTARVEASDRTVAAIDAARRAARVPVYARIRTFESIRRPSFELMVIDLNEPQPVMVEFYWGEEVPDE